MFLLNTLKVLSQRIHLRMLERDRVYPVLLHQRMRGFIRTMDVKLFFEKRVYRTIQAERIAGRAACPQFIINVKTPWAFSKKAYL
jgi:hypothetical protein